MLASGQTMVKCKEVLQAYWLNWLIMSWVKSQGCTELVETESRMVVTRPPLGHREIGEMLGKGYTLVVRR